VDRTGDKGQNGIIHREDDEGIQEVADEEDFDATAGIKLPNTYKEEL
jgi:hypothetical protein